jgi:hypothetical protein
MAWGRQRAREPRAARARFIDDDQMRVFRLQRANELVDIALAGADGAQGDPLGVVGLSDVRDSTRLVVDIQADIQRARLWHGCPPSLWHACWRQEAVVVPVSDPAMHSGAAYPSEVSMSRLHARYVV